MTGRVMKENIPSFVIHVVLSVIRMSKSRISTRPTIESQGMGVWPNVNKVAAHETWSEVRLRSPDTIDAFWCPETALEDAD